MSDLPASPNVASDRDAFCAKVIAELRRPQRAVRYPQLVLTLLLLVLVALGIVSEHLNAVDAPSLLAVLMLHDAGCAVAMRLLKCRDSRAWLLPVFASTRERAQDGVATWRRCVVGLAGVIPGLVLGLVLQSVRPQAAPAGYDVFMALLIGINAFLLLPLEPLDGERVTALTVFAKWPRLQAVCGLLLACGLVILMKFPLAIAAGIVIVLIELQTARWTIAAAAARVAPQVANRVLPNDIGQADEGTLRLLIYAGLPAPGGRGGTGRQIRQCVTRVRASYALLRARSLSPVGSVAIGLGLVGTLGLVGVAWAQNRLGPGSTVVDPRLIALAATNCNAQCIEIDHDPGCEAFCACQIKALVQRVRPAELRREWSRGSAADFSPRFTDMLDSTSAECGSDMYDRRFMHSCASGCDATPECLETCECILDTLRGKGNRVASTLRMIRQENEPHNAETDSHMREVLNKCRKADATPPASEPI